MQIAYGASLSCFVSETVCVPGERERFSERLDVAWWHACDMQMSPIDLACTGMQDRSILVAGVSKSTLLPSTTRGFRKWSLARAFLCRWLVQHRLKIATLHCDSSCQEARAREHFLNLRVNCLRSHEIAGELRGNRISSNYSQQHFHAEYRQNAQNEPLRRPVGIGFGKGRCDARCLARPQICSK